jgi:hypothetical protein
LLISAPPYCFDKKDRKKGPVGEKGGGTYKSANFGLKKDTGKNPKI